MASIIAHLNFNGNCREAMKFYEKCLGGELELTTYGDSTIRDRVASSEHNLILHSVLKTPGLTIYGADGFGEHEVHFGDNVTLSLECKTEDEVRDLFSKLSNGGKVTMPMDKPFWGGLFGQFTDKFGVGWMTVFQERDGSE